VAPHEVEGNLLLCDVIIKYVVSVCWRRVPVLLPIFVVQMMHKPNSGKDKALMFNIYW